MQIGLYDTQSKHPSIKYVHISGSSPGPTTAVDLEEALPLQHLLAPVGLCKESIATAVDSLEADATAGRAPAEVDSDLGSRSFGAALQAVLRSSAQTCICLNLHDSRLCVTLLFGGCGAQAGRLGIKLSESRTTSSWYQLHLNINMQGVSLHINRHKHATLCCLMLDIDIYRSDCC